MKKKTRKVIISVAVCAPVEKLYTYSVPAALIPEVESGKRVLASFNNRDIIGYILETDIDGESIDFELRDITDILDQTPLFSVNLIPFFKWISEYYLCPVGMVIQSALPGGLNVLPFKSGTITDKGIAALESSATKPEYRQILEWIKNNPGKRLSSPFYRYHQLEKKGLISIEKQKPSAPAGPLMWTYVKYKEGHNPVNVLDNPDITLKADNEPDFLKCLSSEEGKPLRDVCSIFSNGNYLVEKWVKKGVLEKYSKEVFRDPAGTVINVSPPPECLSYHQENVLESFKKGMDKGSFATFLLYGVTGSGKTEVYYNAISHAISLGKQAIMLVPEIALTIFTEGLFRSRLGNRVALFHSGLSKGERYDQWMTMLRGEVDLVIGARSALFAPLSRLGLIIVDEEYDSSYKQEESPRYQARDAAVARAKMENAVVVLGSGTPSVQSFHNTEKKHYNLVSMPERVEKRPMPHIEVVDMKSLYELEKFDKKLLLSPALKNALVENFERGKQAILFLNRRGFSRIYLCPSCGESVKCPNCDLTLTYHMNARELTCHYCEFKITPDNKCPSCRHEGMIPYGFGTEKLERELVESVPEQE